MTRGAHHDAINDLFGFWNWVKDKMLFIFKPLALIVMLASSILIGLHRHIPGPEAKGSI